MSDEYSIQGLKRGDIVEFPDNPPNMRFCVVYGGTGCMTYTLIKRIDGFFGSSQEGAVEAMKAGTMGTTERQRCKKVGKIEDVPDRA